MSARTLLPPRFAAWFEQRGWHPHDHQLAMLQAAEAGESVLLIAPTGGGKTLAGFLPSLVELERSGSRGLHTLYVSPLKALTTDIARNLQAPIAEMGLAVRCETRTGDTPQNRRVRQRLDPPDILLTTPELLALLLSYPEALKLFGGLRCVVVDELHALASNKRGQLLALGLARLARLARRPPRRPLGDGEPARGAACAGWRRRAAGPPDRGGAGARAGRQGPDAGAAPALGRPLGDLRRADALRGDPAGRHHPGVQGPFACSGMSG